jgi:hypothetical protein
MLFHAGGWADGQAQTDRRTDLTKLIMAFRNCFAKAPKNAGTLMDASKEFCVEIDAQASYVSFRVS